MITEMIKNNNSIPKKVDVFVRYKNGHSQRFSLAHPRSLDEIREAKTSFISSN